MKRKRLSEDGRDMFRRVTDTLVHNLWIGIGGTSLTDNARGKFTIKTPDGKKYRLTFEETA